MSRGLLVIKLIRGRKTRLKARQGFMLLEGLMATLIILFIVITVVGEVLYSQRVSARSIDTARANSLALEAIEAVKDIRMADFFALNEGTYGLATNSEGQWELVANQSEAIENYFQRTINISTIDVNNHRKVEAVVSWPVGQELRLVTEFKNWLATYEDWSQPQYDGDFDLNPQNSGSNNHKVRALLVKGMRFFAGNDNSAGKEFLSFNLLNAPNITIDGSLDLDGSPEDFALYQSFIFIASGSQTEELQVVDTSNPSMPLQVYSTDLTGNNDALSADINSSSQLLVLGRAGGGVYVFNVSSPAQPSQVGFISLSGSPNINDVKIINSTVFIAASDGSLRTVDISNPQLPAQLANLPLSGCGNALSLDVTSTRFYIGCSGSASQPEIFVGDATNPSNPLLISTASIGGNGADINHISYDDKSNLLFLLTGDTSKDFQVWNLANELVPVLLSFTNLNGSPTQADYSPLVQRMFVGLTSDPEIQIIAPKIIDQPL